MCVYRIKPHAGLKSNKPSSHGTVHIAADSDGQENAGKVACMVLYTVTEAYDRKAKHKSPR